MFFKIFCRGIVGGFIVFICVIVLIIYGFLKVLDFIFDFYWIMVLILGVFVGFVLVGVIILYVFFDVEIYREL